MSARRLVLASVLLASSGCFSYAPPVRMGHYGAPGRTGAGMFEMGGSYAYHPAYSGTGSVGYGVTESVTVEAGAEGKYESWAIGWAGVRYTPELDPARVRGLHVDVEGGAGAGAGGRECEGNDCSVPPDALRRVAGGGYLGLGLGYEVRDWFSPWVRARSQLSAAHGVPFTSLTTALLGVQFSISQTVHLWAGTGGYFVATPQYTGGGWFTVNGGLSLTLATPRAEARRAHRARGR